MKYTPELCQRLNAIETISAPKPEKIPFKNTICKGFLEDSFFVQLFSSPQHKQAPRTKREPKENLTFSKEPIDKRIHDIVINKIPIQSLICIFSLNIIKAINEVATISKFPKRTNCFTI